MATKPRRRKRLGRQRVRRIEIEGDLDVHAAEALELEIQRLARQYRAEIRDVTTAAPAGRRVRLP